MLSNFKLYISMTTREHWRRCFHPNNGNPIFFMEQQEKVAKSIVMDHKFWKSIVVCLKGANPLIKLLHLVSSDTKPAIGFIYEEMKQAKVKIQRAFKSVKKR